MEAAVKSKRAPVRETQRQKAFPKPYERAGKYYLEDEDVAKVNAAILERRKRQTELLTRRANKIHEVGVLQANLMRSRLKYSKKELSDVRASAMRLADEARVEYEPFDVTTLPQYQKRPYPTIAGSCVTRNPTYDFGSDNPWGGGIGGIRIPSGRPQDGNLGGGVTSLFAGSAGVTCDAGLFFFTGEGCGTLRVTSTFRTTGNVFLIAILGFAWLALTLKTSIFDLTQGKWFEGGFDIYNTFCGIGSSSATFENQPNTTMASAVVLQNRMYFVMGETVLSAATGFEAGITADFMTSLTSVETCL
jgi:hypothetical protein